MHDLRVIEDVARAVVAASDDVHHRQIVGTGATVDELAHGQAWYSQDEPMLNADEREAQACARQSTSR